jgi:hypothetical protein
VVGGEEAAHLLGGAFLASLLIRSALTRSLLASSIFLPYRSHSVIPAP